MEPFLIYLILGIPASLFCTWVLCKFSPSSSSDDDVTAGLLTAVGILIWPLMIVAGLGMFISRRARGS